MWSNTEVYAKVFVQKVIWVEVKKRSLKNHFEVKKLKEHFIHRKKF